ncbi:8-oxo-dGTPase [Mobilisporobacter senegalensis]|uniref:8-oxo-dGTPase n=1 Tax=Mobilisporobacter senegalensis TaxID=1329262 RepID=A0A3N1XA37_9FIRM|nr:NUDIX domain-containing protein [Mobilisporobacter senegalensis]ROR23619.1 8-oxo-dGTPase [Mobilisporobacter senegalensis]
MKVKFHDQVEDNLIKFAVIISKFQNKWVFCKHKARDTYECPGGHREPEEDILTAAKRELYEETGATEYTMVPISVYSVSSYDGVTKEETETFGMLYYADIKVFGELPEYEIEKVELFKELPDRWTYPLIQPELIKKINTVIVNKST